MQQPAPEEGQVKAKRPLAVDLDGSLLQSDSMLEAICAVVRRRTSDILRLPFWLCQGLPYFKKRVYERMDADLAKMPWNQEVLQALEQEHAQGRSLILATGAHQDFADKVSQHFGIFSAAFGTQDDRNLTGQAKAKLLVEHYGKKGFDYLGNSRVDKAVWQHSQSAWVVSHSSAFRRDVQLVVPIEREFAFSPSSLKAYLKAVRVHQWAKNALIFLPILLSHQYFEWQHWWLTLLAFASFSCIASSVYLINDLLDIEADRRHPDNRKRPFAAGTLSILAGFELAPLLLSLGLGIELYLSTSYFLVVSGYFLMTCLYSFRLKQIPIADILVLAILYTWRVLAGAVATETIITEWFLTFALFFFFSLALLKRCSELILMEQNQEKKQSRRGYLVADLPLLVACGMASGYLSVLVLALYLNDTRVTAHLRYPEPLWALCPLLLYWLSRLWLMAYRGKMTTDPLVFALKDKISYSVVLIIGLLWLMARGPALLSFVF